jgi:hypothetical protein
LIKRVAIQDDFNFIILPKIVKWFRKDFLPNQEDDSIHILKALHAM